MTWELQLCAIGSLKFCWNKEDSPPPQVFTLKLISTYMWLIKNYVDKSEMNYHQHQGCYESFKFVGMHVVATNYSKGKE